MSHSEGLNLDRRDLLRGLLATGGLLSAAPHLLWADEPEELPPAQFRFGLVTYLWGQDLTLPRLINS